MNPSQFHQFYLKPFFAAIFAFCACRAMSADDFTSVLQQYGNGIVFLSTHKDGSGNSSISSGTGFLIDQNGTIITCAHVLAGAQQVWARFPSGEAKDCDLIDEDTAHDVAAIRVRQMPASSVAVLHLAPEADGPPPPLTELLLISNPLDLTQTPTTGTFSSVRNSTDIEQNGQPLYNESFDIYQVQIPGTYGSSGGPVITHNGDVIGVFAGGLRGGSLQLNFCIPEKYVHSLQLNNDPHPFSAGTGNFNFATSFSSVGMDYDNSSAPIANSASGVPINLKSDNWGFIIPGTVGMFMDDIPKAYQLLPPQFYQQVAANHRLVHIVNIFNKYSVVVPENYSIHEDYDDQAHKFTSTFTRKDTGEQVIITSTKIPPYSLPEMDGRLANYGHDYLVNTLNLSLVPPPFIPPPQPFMPAPLPPPLQVGQAYQGPLSDLAPRNDPLRGRVKFWRQYMEPAANQVFVVLYAMDGDEFVTLQVPYNLSDASGPIPPSTLTERMLIAATFSFIQ